MRVLGQVRLVISLLAISSQALADQPRRNQPRGGIEFPACDGFGPVMPGGDGITKEVGGFWVGKSDRVRRPPVLGRWIDECSAAIALLDRAYPDFQIRKVSLLQSRAAHKLAKADITGALEDLQLADGVLPSSADVFYLRSTAINTDLIRIYALVEAGRVAEAEVVAQRVIERRPQARMTTVAIFTAMGDTGSRALNDRLLDNLAKFHPNASVDQFTYFFETGRFEQALGLYDAIPDLVMPISSAEDEREADLETETARMTAAVLRVKSMYRRSYALAALGRGADALAALEAAQQYLAQQSTDPAPLSADANRRAKTNFAVKSQVNLRMRTHLRPFTTAWSNVVNARLGAATGSNSQAILLLSKEESHLPSYAFLDAWKSAGRSVSEDPRPAIPPEYRGSIAGLQKRSLTDLFSILLDAETEERTLGFKPTWDNPYMGKDRATRGGCNEEAPVGNLASACFAGLNATLGVTEEKALLRAALLTLADGKSHFQIVKRDDINSTFQGSYQGVRGPIQQLGYETRLRFEKKSSADNCNRCISAAAIKAQLEPLYLGGNPQQSAN